MAAIAERSFAEYRDKVVEEIGKNKEQKIRDTIAQEQGDKNPPGKQIIITGGGNVLCCELYTMRYFRSDMESLRRAENKINSKINNELYVSLSEFYYILGLRPTCVSDEVGWNSDKLMELEFSTIMSEDNEPCIAFKYNYVKPVV